MGAPVRILNNVAVAAVQDYVSDIIEPTDPRTRGPLAEGDTIFLSVSSHWSGNPTGTFVLYQSNLDQPGINPARPWWTDTGISFVGNEPAGAPDGGFVDVPIVGGFKYLLVYSHTGGNGVIDAFATTKVSGEAGAVGPQGPPGPQGIQGVPGGGGGGGAIRITGITVPGGSTANPVFQDPPANTILQSIDVSNGTFDVAVEAAYPEVDVNGVLATLPPVNDGDHYGGTVSVTIAAAGPVIATVIDGDGVPGAIDTVLVNIDAPPQLIGLSFVGGYPGFQTELKAGDTYQVSFTTDIPCDAIEIQDAGASDAVQLLTFAPTTNGVITMVVGDRGTVLQALPATGRPRSPSTGAFGANRATNQLGGAVDGTDLINLNNLFPGIALGAITYPATQGALKNVEVATVVNALTDFDTVAYDSPNGDLTITNPAISEDPKTVTRLAGAYNDSVDNFRITANRAANDATTVDALVVVIANVAAQLTVTEPAARLISGGNNGTAPQDHQITITADQQLGAAPTLAPDGGGPRGVFQGGAFVGGPSIWTRDLRVVDNDDKGVFAWGAINGVNLAGIVTAAITGDGNYTLGGFVARTLTFGPFATQTQLDVEVVTFANLQAGTFTSTGQAALRQPIGTPPSVTDGYTIDAVGINPAQVIWLDTPAAAANSTGTAQITNVEEVA